jgi:alpha-ribazole phosphatase
MAELLIWRHPKPVAAAGRCIGRTDLAVDPRRAKRLAHRIRSHARRHGLPREIVTSPLRRSAEVGRWLRRWGWGHRVDAGLIELDFGAWEGRPWRDIPFAEVSAWEADFADHAPGRGESLQQLRTRVAVWLAALVAAGQPRLAVGHAGWMNALALLDAANLTATHWPAAPRHAQGMHYVPFRRTEGALAVTMRRL